MKITRSVMSRAWARMFARILLAIGLAVSCFAAVAPASAQTLLQSNARYARVRLLPSGELIATVLLFPTDYRVKVFSSTNNGASWTAVGMVSQPDFATLHTSSPDFIVMPNGDLILGLNVDTSACATCRSTIRIFRSTDKGRTWSFLSNAQVSANNKGFWEPNFSIASDGALVLLYSDESSACCSQKLVRIRSYDGGATWQDLSNLTRLSSSSTDATHNLRPGMPYVSKLTDGTGRYLVTYEMCGKSTPDDCQSYYKTSTDGWNYGPETATGTAMSDSLGRYFAGSPVNKALPGGALMWLGHFLRVADGSPSGLTGQVIFKSASGSPSGPWSPINAPVPLPHPSDTGCEGYSPGLQWVNGGSTLVQLTMVHNLTSGNCDIYYGTGPS